MTINNLNKYLDKIPTILPTDVWIRPTELNYIILESDANQFFNPLTQKMYIDSTSGLIKIKYSHLEPITAPLDRFSYNSTENALYIYNGRHTVYSSKRIREPKVGDKVCAFNAAKDTSITYSVIKEIKENSYGTKIILNDKSVITKIENEKVPMKFFILLQGTQNPIKLNNTVELYKEPKDKTYSDIYIDAEHIIGFEFDMKWRPNE